MPIRSLALACVLASAPAAAKGLIEHRPLAIPDDGDTGDLPVRVLVLAQVGQVSEAHVHWKTHEQASKYELTALQCAPDRNPSRTTCVASIPRKAVSKDFLYLVSLQVDGEQQTAPEGGEPYRLTQRTERSKAEESARPKPADRAAKPPPARAPAEPPTPPPPEPEPVTTPLVSPLADGDDEGPTAAFVAGGGAVLAFLTAAVAAGLRNVWRTEASTVESPTRATELFGQSATAGTTAWVALGVGLGLGTAAGVLLVPSPPGAGGDGWNATLTGRF